MLAIFNRIFTSGDYPKSWGEGIIVPIFKGGDINDAKNYRGITLINSIAKIYSQVLLNRLTKWSEKHNIIIENQFGFQKGKSTIDNLFILQTIINKTLATNKKLYCAFVDFEKCFDKLNRLYIFQKLRQENVSTLFINAIQNMYRAVKSSVKYKHDVSQLFDSNIGVKQGDPSSTLLFLFFVNDICTSFNENIEGLFTLNEIKLYLLMFATIQCSLHIHLMHYNHYSMTFKNTAMNGALELIR